MTTSDFTLLLKALVGGSHDNGGYVSGESGKYGRHVSPYTRRNTHTWRTHGGPMPFFMRTLGNPPHGFFGFFHPIFGSDKGFEARRWVGKYVSTESRQYINTT